MARITLACAVIAGITGAGCSLGMTDLSQSSKDGDPNGDPQVVGGANGGRAAADDPMLADNGAGAQASGSAPSTPSSNVPAQPQPKAAPSCQLITLTPTTAVTLGTGRAWQSPISAIAEDGNPSTTALSTDNRESAQLQLGGFGGATIPANAVVRGLLVDISRGSGSTCIVAQEVSAIIAGGGRARGDVGDKWQGTHFYGSPEDTWGGAIAPTAFDASFAVRIKTRMVGTRTECPNERDARVDRVQVRVHYCVN